MPWLRVASRTPGSAGRTQPDDSRIELPGIGNRLIGRQHCWTAVAPGTGEVDLLPGEYDAIRWYDTEDSIRSLGAVADRRPVGRRTGRRPATGNGSGGDGYSMTHATDRTDASSWLLDIPADNPGSGPVARVRTPVRVPLGLHGNWLPNEERTLSP
ncbi:carotenoid oxygenase family protein [Streptomyces sp. NBC_00873]|uniref:carotenoid oxygenase family protein n=1 Tax=unclassified Streptomyces TaxID=2593676 RepID=UPI00386FADD6|nr:carotenoid oxygenase family protein [Streptomyces sp. NBC_00873]WTA42211.1 carotenoid oxygenase family protein [Streptomyces sp. NBC_00842]